MRDYLWRSIMRLSHLTKAEGETMKKETLEKITTRLCWSILMAGLGYAWAYYHWISWAAAKGLSL